MNFKTLPEKFYIRDTISVAKELPGKILVKKEGKKILSGKIVEVEAYIGDHDPACHAYKKFTNRNKPMYEAGGTIYVYFVYGNYHCLNFVTNKKGIGDAVLIRGIEPLEGIDIMKRRRIKAKTIYDLTNGPAKICLAFGIDKRYNYKKLYNGNLILTEGYKEKFKIIKSKRIGINTGKDFNYRFFIKDNPYVTKHEFNKTGIPINN
jgi:DNA-3-methyladenine glycosylase